jgi:tRNA dimethylallyltransferase
MKGKINIITGATATGKTAYAIKLAKELSGIILNADSMQVYKELPILTAQPSYTELQQAEHRLYGFLNCNEHFDVAIWISLVTAEISKVLKQGKTPILVGGTGMYIKSLIEGLSDIPKISEATKQKVRALKNPHNHLSEVDPATALKLEKKDLQRIYRALDVYYETDLPLSEWKTKPKKPHFSKEQIYLEVIEVPREELYKKIDQRFLTMINSGAIDEVRNVYEKYGDIDYPKATGFYEILEFIKGKITREEMIEKSQQSTRNYGKRQMTFMRNQFTHFLNS